MPTLQEGSTGPNVKRLQNALKGLGWDRTGPSDGVFGPMTTRSVMGFQASAGLDVDGIVGPLTWDAITKARAGLQAVPAPPAPVVAPGASVWAQGLLATALAELKKNVVENPVGSNGGGRVDVYTGNWQVPWCALFVSWCVRQQPGNTLSQPIAAVISWKQRLVGQGRFRASIAAGAPAPGDAFIILYAGAEGVDSGHGHIGLVVSYDAAAGTIRTVEGNASNGVRSNVRKLSTLAGWGPVGP